MSLVTWKDTLSVGVDMIDDQHRTLIELLNQLDERVRVGVAPMVLSGALDRLIWHTAMHFADEEALMKSNSYPMAAAHVTEHYGLVKVAINLQKRLAGSPGELTEGDMMFMRDWLQHHVQGSDRRLGDFLQTRGVIVVAEPALA